MGDFDDEPDTDVETLGDDAVVEVSDAEIAAEIINDPVTKPHDGGEFLAGFRQGVTAGRQDVFDSIRRLFGDSGMAKEIVRRVVEELATKS